MIYGLHVSPTAAYNIPSLPSLSSSRSPFSNKTLQHLSSPMGQVGDVECTLTPQVCKWPITTVTRPRLVLLARPNDWLDGGQSDSGLCYHSSVPIRCPRIDSPAFCLTRAPGRSGHKRTYDRAIAGRGWLANKVLCHDHCHEPSSHPTAEVSAYFYYPIILLP